MAVGGGGLGKGLSWWKGGVRDMVRSAGQRMRK